MIKESTIVTGTKAELVEHFIKLSWDMGIKRDSSAGGILYSKEGFERQIDDLLRVGNNGMGIIFYLTRREEDDDKIGVEVTLELLSSYVCIIEPG